MIVCTVKQQEHNNAHRYNHFTSLTVTINVELFKGFMDQLLINNGIPPFLTHYSSIRHLEWNNNKLATTVLV